MGRLHQPTISIPKTGDSVIEDYRELRQCIGQQGCSIGKFFDPLSLIGIITISEYIFDYGKLKKLCVNEIEYTRSSTAEMRATLSTKSGDDTPSKPRYEKEGILLRKMNRLSLTVFIYGDSSEEDDGEDGDGIGGKTHSAAPKRYDSSVFDFPDPSRKSALPSAFDAFSQVSGPPEFLNHAVEEPGSVSDSTQQQGRRGGRKDFKDKKDMPSGAVVETKPQLVGIHDRVRSDIEGSKPPTSSVPSSKQDGAKRVASATNPNAQDAAELLRCRQRFQEEGVYYQR
ncbi:Endoplasmic reticulum vesicle transporter protein [Hibiscus syriacus]|uniref:Endoplasmic reticulum vesicle transporter protein n=1 Tax=Hibiscus syriacus TaxID=106335 RepID=A0A6A2XXA2_HIBSY|nr:Endoplasmic reticulum vesicle transporter protein [Hibiscus syriacus]